MRQQRAVEKEIEVLEEATIQLCVVVDKLRNERDAGCYIPTHDAKPDETLEINRQILIVAANVRELLLDLQMPKIVTISRSVSMSPLDLSERPDDHVNEPRCIPIHVID